MKRIVSLLIVFSLILSLSSCLKIERVELPAPHAVAPSPDDPGEDVPSGSGSHRHLFISEDGDSIKLCKCAFDGCNVYGRQIESSEIDEKLEEYLDYKDTFRDISAFCKKFLKEMKKVPKYDEELHAFSEEGELFDESRDAVSKMETLDEYSDYVTDVTDVVYLYYVSDMERYEDSYYDVQEYAIEFQQKYYRIELALYDSAYREYVFREDDGWTEGRLEEEMTLAKEYSDDTLAELEDAVSELSIEIDMIDDPMESDETPEYMARLVEANNALARYYGYDNYFEYAMWNEYGRDYTVSDADALISYVKKYFTPLLWDYQNRYLDALSSSWSAPADSVCSGSITNDRLASEAVYCFLKKVDTCMTAGKSYYDSANDAFREGRARTIGEGGGFTTAFTYYIGGLASPLMCFSDDYVGITTFIHEHGHYYAYLTDSSDQVSLDVNETQSQGAELLFASYFEEFFGDKGYRGADAALASALYSNIMSLVDCCCEAEFERVLYTGDASGLDDPEGRLADGVTSDEYDYLYDCILSDYQIAPSSDRYWRITAPAYPCYYLSYAVSLIPSLQIFTLSRDRGFEAGAASYLSFFDFQNTKEFEDRTTSDVEFACAHAGLGSPFDEETFISLSKALK